MLSDRVILGDCTVEMRGFPEDSIDCVVTDPPYGLNFMGKAWDKALPPRQAFVEMCRVLKPGALAFVMSSPRQDLMWRMAQLLEESGFELGQSFISWVYASGFPKAYDIGKGIDNKLGKSRDTEYREPFGREGRKSKVGGFGREGYQGGELKTNLIPDSKPASSEAREWSGWKSVTGLKPALEVVFMVQKPLSEKTIVDNVLRWGVGAMNVDATRIPIGNGEEVEDFERSTGGFSAKSGVYHNDPKYQLKDFNSTERGRFPANLLVSDDALNDGKSHEVSGTAHLRKLHNNKPETGIIYGKYNSVNSILPSDEGSFSRYFDLDQWSRHHGFLNVPKAGTGEREYGLYGLGEKKEYLKEDGSWGSHEIFSNQYTEKSGNPSNRGKTPKRRNIHPTVKPVELMGYLIELGCPRGGVVLDPFVGSGTTCVAAKKLGRRFIGIEIDPASHKIAESRVAAEPVKIEDMFTKTEHSEFVVNK